MRHDFSVVDSHLIVPLQISGRIGNFADENVGSNATDVIDQLCLKQQVTSWQQVIGDVVLRAAHGHSVTDAQRAQHVENLGISAVFLQ